jgi:hypothetical protein
MPFQDSLPLLVGCLVAAGVCFWLWRTAGQSIWLGLALAVGAVGIAAATVDHLTITDREELELLLPRLAKAVQAKDLPTVLASIAPEVRPVRRQAEDAVKRFQPSQVVITKLEVEVDQTRAPLTAVAELLVRVSGRIAEQNEATGIVAATVTLEKRDRWLVTDCVVRPAEPLAGRSGEQRGRPFGLHVQRAGPRCHGLTAQAALPSRLLALKALSNGSPRLAMRLR